MEEAVDLSSDRLLMMMIPAGVVSNIQVLQNALLINTGIVIIIIIIMFIVVSCFCLIFVQDVSLQYRNCVF